MRRWATWWGVLLLVALVGVVGSVPARAMGGAAQTGGLRAELREIVGGGVPGVVVVARDRGRPVRRVAAGLADIPARRAMRAGDRFRVASITKTFVAAVVLRLVAEHRLALDRPIAGLLAEPVPDAGRITVRDLLDHGSGLVDYSDDPRFDPGAAYTPARLIALSAAHEPYFAPGTGFHYSSTNYIVLGEIVRHVTGRPVQDEVRARLIRPLHLTGTTFPTATTVAPGQARGYAFATPLPPRTGPARDVTTRTSASAAGAAAAMVSTGDDVDRFLGALLAGRLVPRRLLTEMKRPTPGSAAFFTAAGMPGITYGLGLMIASTPCGTAYASMGDIDGYTSSVMSRGHRQTALLMNTASLQPSLRQQAVSAAERQLCRTS